MTPTAESLVRLRLAKLKYLLLTASIIGVWLVSAAFAVPPVLYPDCVCNTTNPNGGRPGDSVSAYFRNWVNHLPAGTIVGNITGSCSLGFPGCDTNNYLVDGGFKARIQRWESDVPGFIYPYKYYGVIQ
jgi:hypothetical protein